ncbi:MAG: HIT family protein [Acidimicrobiales bacterium]
MSLEQLWAGWRHEYVTQAGLDEHSGRDDGCVFCRIEASGTASAENGVVWRGELVFAVLNAYPYATAHLLVLPRRHVSELAHLTVQESTDLWRAAERAVAVLGTAYRPDGFNIGANLGRAAGAGIPRHLHLHVLPRWSGDTNFMTSVAGVRVMPESLATTWAKVHGSWPSST